jgi:hypothetical protein
MHPTRLSLYVGCGYTSASLGASSPTTVLTTPESSGLLGLHSGLLLLALHLGVRPDLHAGLLPDLLLCRLPGRLLDLHLGLHPDRDLHLGPMDPDLSSFSVAVGRRLRMAASRRCFVPTGRLPPRHRPFTTPPLTLCGRIQTTPTLEKIYLGQETIFTKIPRIQTGPNLDYPKIQARHD